MEKKYYVYVYLDPRKKGEFIYGEYKFDYEPFYVGKGINNRYLKHLTENEQDTENLFKFRTIEKIKAKNLLPIITKVVADIEESEAYKIESELIKLIGRRCDKSGCLTNIVTDAKPPINYKTLTKKVIKKIIQLYNEGHYLKHIGDKLGLNENKVKRTLIENGIKPKRKPPTNKKDISVEVITGMCDDYNNGFSIRGLKIKYNISFNVIRRLLNENGVKIKGYNYKKSDEHKQKLKESYVAKFGEEHHSFKPLTQEEINKLKHLRFVENKTIREIMRLLNINQKKYYYYINT